MLSSVFNDFHTSDAFTSFGDMESEIAELRTMTRVTKLRQQIECRQDGVWMRVRDVPDDRSKSGTRKVTSYGRASRSVTRSYSSNVNTFNGPEPLVEFPEEPSDEPSAVEIVEVTDEPTETTKVPDKTSPSKKTSVVTLGKGNMVLIDPEDSLFRVTGISKGKVAEAVSTLERAAGEKKVKKVGFSKTEVHFAPDSGRVNIVETDEKPPSSQLLRRKKRLKPVPKKSLPKLYFGGEPPEEEPQPLKTDHAFPIIREPSPLLSTSFTAQATKSKSPEPTAPLAADPPNDKPLNEVRPLNGIDYIGNVSPTLTKLIQNSIQHEFQLKQIQIMGKTPEMKKNSLNITLGPEPVKPLKIVTQVQFGQNGAEEFSVKHNEMGKASEPIYINSKMSSEGKRPVAVTQDKAPKPKPRSSITKINSEESRDARKPKPRPVSSLSDPKKTRPTVKKDDKKEAFVRPVKSYTRTTLSRQTGETCNKVKVKADVTQTSQKLQKLIKTTNEKGETTATRTKKPREPLRSFEKVSNGWVGHCIVPVKPMTKTGNITITTNLYTTPPTSAKSTGVKRSTITVEPKAPPRSKPSPDKTHAKPPLTSVNRQFSLSKEHLKSAKLVKELSNPKPPKAGDSPKKPETARPRVNVVRPRIIEEKNLRTKSAVRRLSYNDPYGRLRRDSDQSDDSVIRADEEVRAYMFNTRHKVFLPNPMFMW